jgi:DNA-binding IclR family transcriptional regulator
MRDPLVPGISALANPVYDARGTIVLTLTAIGPSATFDGRPEGAVASALHGAPAALSARLDHRAPHGSVSDPPVAGSGPAPA